MKKQFLFVLLICSSCIYGQLPTVKNNKLIFSAIVNMDNNNRIRGYLWHLSDTVVFISPHKKINSLNQPGELMALPADNINSFTIKKRKIEWGYAVVGAVVGFIIGAGISNNPDIDNDGETSFIELIFSAIEGSTSRNRSRRTTALYIGMGTGLAGFGMGLFADRKITIRLPLFDRKKELKNQRSRVESFINNY